MNCARCCGNTKLNLMNAMCGIKAQPRWGWMLSPARPRVARASQPWAGGHNPFGIERSNFKRSRKRHWNSGRRCDRLSLCGQNHARWQGKHVRELERLWSDSFEAVAPIAVGKSQRDFALQPKVARHELPWVNRATNPKPQRGCANRPDLCRNLYPP